MKTLGAYMIVKDEESCIATCLKSIINICDEIIIVDTGCSDKTMDIVASFNLPKIKTSTFQWVNDFSAARNYAMSLTTADYVFTTDADEEFTTGLQNKIKEFKEHDFYDGTVIEMWLLNKNKDTEDTKYLGGRSIIKNDKTAKWRYKIHEKLYCNEKKIIYIPFEDGYINHNHKGNNSTDAYNKYAEFYFNELNGDSEIIKNNDAHFFYYLFFTLKDIDILLAKSYLIHLFNKKKIISKSEEQRVNLLADDYISKDEFLILSALNELDADWVRTFFYKFNDNNNIAQYIALTHIYNTFNYLDEKNGNYILPSYGVLLYNNGEILKFVEVTKKHLELFPDSNLAKYNNDFIKNYIVPFQKKYKLAIDCFDTSHLPSMIFYLSRYFDKAYLFNCNEKNIREKYNINAFKKVYFINEITEISGTVITVKSSECISKSKTISYFNNLICNGDNNSENDIFHSLDNVNNTKVALCTIARMENKYMREYIEHYKNVGFDKIFIYDNGRPDEEKVIDEINDYVKSGFVDVIEWPIFEGNAQKPAYQDCFDKHKSEYDWIAFFDADEYFMPCNCNNVKTFLSNKIYDGFGGVAIPMKNFDDNDIIVNNSKTRLDKYTRQVKDDWRRFLKTIVRCAVNNVDFFSNISDGCHLPYMKNHRICDADGGLTSWNNTAYLYNKKSKNAYLKHIPTGCIDDFINGKDKRGWPDTHNDMTFGLEYFGYYNELTQEKIDYYNKHKIN